MCAERQGRFWGFHDALFAEGHNLDEAGLVALARAVGLDEKQFRECLNDPSAAERVRRDVELGRKAGVDGTPALFVNGRRIADVHQLGGALRQAWSQPGRGR